MVATATDHPALGRRLAGNSPSWQLQVLLGYLASRFATLIGVWAAVAIQHRPVAYALTRWDARWYLWIAGHGYPRSVNTLVFDGQSPHAFLPLFPVLVRVLRPAFAGHLVVAALALNLLLGAVFALAVRTLAAQLMEPRAATRAAILVLFFPGAYVLSLAYSEALALALAALALLALLRRRWLLAGVAGGLATATRSAMLAISVAAAVAALVAIKQRRDWRSLLAPVLSLGGIAVFFVYQRLHTGVPNAWQQAEYRFGQRRDFLRTFLGRIPGVLHSALAGDHANYTLWLVGLIAIVPLLLFAVRPVLHPVLLVYSLAIIGPCLLYSSVNARPRFLFAAFPLVFAYARRAGPRMTAALAAAGAVAMAGLTYAYLGASYTIP